MRRLLQAQNPSAPATFSSETQQSACRFARTGGVNRPALHAFFEQHAREGRRVLLRKVLMDRGGQAPNKGPEPAVTVSEGVMKLQLKVVMHRMVVSPGGLMTGADPVLEVLEGWVDQLHGYIDNTEQGIEILERLGSGIIVDAHRGHSVVLQGKLGFRCFQRLTYIFVYFTSIVHSLSLLLSEAARVSQGMSAEQLQSLVANRLKQLINERTNPQ